MEVEVLVPAKAMLFGEYGVLSGGSAILVSFWEHRFRIHFDCRQVDPVSDDSRLLDAPIQVQSTFFGTENPLLVPRAKLDEVWRVLQSISLDEVLHQGRNKPFALDGKRDEAFFVAAFAPWAKVLRTVSCSMHILESYSPSLGLGSSSALLAAIACLGQSLGAFECSHFWRGVRFALLMAQGGGSGADLAVQLASLKIDKSLKVNHPFDDMSHDKSQMRFHAFRNQTDSDLPLVDSIAIPSALTQQWGVLLSTGVYADTSHLLKSHFTSDKAALYAREHQVIAAEVLADLAHGIAPNESDAWLGRFMKRSCQVAESQGILPRSSETLLGHLVQLLESRGIAFKTMGAGAGDSLWVLARAEELTNLSHPLTGRPLAEDVIFDFAAPMSYPKN